MPRAKTQGFNPDAWRVGMPQYTVKTYEDHQAPEHGWRYAVYDIRNAYDSDPVIAWCRKKTKAQKIVDALNKGAISGQALAGVS